MFGSLCEKIENLFTVKLKDLGSGKVLRVFCHLHSNVFLFMYKIYLLSSFDSQESKVL